MSLRSQDQPSDGLTDTFKGVIEVIIADLNEIPARRYPARRHTQNIAGGASPIKTKNFAMGYVTLEPRGGQVPWHSHPNEEVYFIIEGLGQMCVGDQLQEVCAAQAVYVPPGEFHQLTNIGREPLKMIYCYGPAGDVDHWKQELSGTLPKAGKDAPPLPQGAWPQHT